MKRKQLFFNLRSSGRLLPGLFTLLLLLTLSACGGKDSVQIYDNAGVLDSSKVQSAASDLSRPIAIYTTNTFRGTEADFQKTAIQKLNGDPEKIVIAIDTNSRYIYIARGSRVPLSKTSVDQAVGSFAGRFNQGDYTNASIAALNSLRDSIKASTQSPTGISFNPAIPCLLLPLLLILGAVLFAAGRRARTHNAGLANRGGLWPPRSPQDNENPHYGPNQGPNQGYGPYDQGYGASNQRGGINPWMAGGLGAAAGGLAGYELGRRAGDQGSPGNAGNGGAFGDGGSGGGGFFGESGAADPHSAFGAGGNFGGSDPDAQGGGFGGGDFFGDGGSNF